MTEALDDATCPCLFSVIQSSAGQSTGDLLVQLRGMAYVREKDRGREVEVER